MTGANTLASTRATFAVDDAAVREKLQQLKARGENLREPMASLGFAWKERIAQQFTDQTDPWGKPWEPLAKRTLRARRDGGKDAKILRNIGLLLNSRAYRSRGGRGLDLFLGDTNRPALIHQFGGMAGRGRKVRIPARPMMPILPSGDVDLPPAWRDELLDVLSAHLDGGE